MACPARDDANLAVLHLTWLAHVTTPLFVVPSRLAVL